MERQGFNLDRIVKYKDIAWSIGEVVLSSALDFVTKQMLSPTPSEHFRRPEEIIQPPEMYYKDVTIFDRTGRWDKILEESRRVSEE